jgi:HSP20 family protein
MYHTKNNIFSRPAQRNSFFDDAFAREFFAGDFKSKAISTPSANILETKDKFSVELSVPGWNKEDFNIQVEGKTLILSAEKKEELREEGIKWNRREFRQHSFKRMFELSENIKTAEIAAKYENGILSVDLPKKEVVKEEATKKIAVL